MMVVMLMLILMMLMMLMVMLMVRMLMATTMRAHKTRECSSTLLFPQALTPLAQQLGIQVLAGVGAVVDAGGNCDDEALRKGKDTEGCWYGLWSTKSKS